MENCMTRRFRFAFVQDPGSSFIYRYNTYQILSRKKKKNTYQILEYSHNLMAQDVKKIL
jgi:hypothetical protein